MDLNFYTQNFRVNYSDVDENNQITNKGLLRLMQEIAGIHCGKLGYGVNDIQKTHLAWIILNWKLQVYTRPNVNTNLVINTWANFKNSLFVYRSFEIYDENKNLVAKAISKWILYDTNKNSISKLTEDIKLKNSGFTKTLFDEKYNEKLIEPKDSTFIMHYTIQRRDIDTNHHVNNLYYLDYAIEALPIGIYKNYEFANVEIMYKHEAKLGDIVSLYYSCKNETEHIITIKNKLNNAIHAIIKLS